MATKKQAKGKGGDTQPAKGGRVVMQVVAFPPTPTRGRPPTKFFKLFEQIAGEYGAGVTVKVIEYLDDKTAYKVAARIRSGETHVPGGAECWVVKPVPEKVTLEGGGEKVGSALYVSWLGDDGDEVES